MKDSKSSTILLVDDDVFILNTYRELLSFSGFCSVLTATDGVEALSVMKEHPVDLLITDINMPRMGGVELIQELRVSYPDLPILVISGYLKSEHLPALDPFHVDGIFCKPFRVADLIAKIQSLL
jgi:two-component system, response regulator YesN